MFNIACGDRVSLLGLVDKINAIVGSKVEPELLPARPGDIRDSYADISKANVGPRPGGWAVSNVMLHWNHERKRQAGERKTEPAAESAL